MNRRTLRSAAEIADAGLLPAEDVEVIDRVARRYAVAIPAYIVEQIREPVAVDPVARQYLPDARELVIGPEEREDPIGDRRHSPVEGIVHRYPDRVLFKVVHTCPVYCRFCFRREMVGPGKEGNLTPAQLSAAIDYIRNTPRIREVIFTGGDPLMLADHRIDALVRAMDDIRHVERLRWHTRYPVVSPERINESLLEVLKARRAKTIVAVHANHPREFTPEAHRALRQLHDNGISLLSQSVLLKGVNDSARVLAELLDAFAAAGVQPYYLHHADLAPGTGHFRTTISEGRMLMQELRTREPRRALPTYVLDLPGGYSKVDLESADAAEVAPGKWRLRDDTGQWHDYTG